MMFFFKRKKVYVDAFTYRPAVYKYFPMVTSNECIPEWWKRTPKWTDLPGMGNNPPLKDNTIRRCTGVIDYYSSNIIMIRLWSDMVLEYNDTGSRFNFADGETQLLFHSQTARGEFLPNYHHFKINSPWKIREKTGINFHFSQPFYNFEDPAEVLIPPGIINYKYQPSTEYNFMARKKEGDSVISWEAGRPIVHLLPQTEHEIVLKNHLLTEQEYRREFPYFFAFGNRYHKAKKILEKQEEKKGKCPFHFG